MTTESSSTQTDTENKTSTANGIKDDKATTDYIEGLIDKKISDKLGLNRETTASERNPALPTVPTKTSNQPMGTPL